MKAVRMVGLAVLFAAATASCQKEPIAERVSDTELPAEMKPQRVHVDLSKVAVPALFANVPADTPYLVGSFDDTPAEVLLSKFKSFIGPFLSTISSLTGGDLSEQGKLARALLSELTDNWKGTSESLGLVVPMQFAMYGLDLQPVVLRVALKDPEKLIATIQRVATNGGATLPPLTTAGTSRYWKVVDDGVGVVIGFTSDQLILSLGSPDQIDAKLGLILGSDKPAQSLADGKQIKDLLGRYGFSPTVFSYIDVKRAGRIGARFAGVTSPACDAAVDQLAQDMPRIVFGYGQQTPQAISAAMVVELAPAIVAKLRDLRTEVPGLATGLADRPLLGFGAGFDVTKGQQLALAVFDSVHSAAKTCRIDALTSGADEVRRDLAKPVPAPFNQIAGGYFAVRSVAFTSDAASRRGTPIPDQADAVAGIVAPDGKALAEQLYTFEPKLRALGIASDGKLHDTLVPLPVPFKVAAAIGDKSIIVATGDKRLVNGAPLLDAKAHGKAPLFAMSYDYGKVLELMLKAQGVELSQLPPDQASMFKGMRDAFGPISMAADVSDSGVEIWTTSAIH